MMRILALVLLIPPMVSAQPGRGGQAPALGRTGAPVDLTGYWVSPVMEDYRWRMITPLKGDAASVPINDAARKIVDAWDPAKDEAAGLQCKAYGAPAIMRVPGRLHITWQDDNTLKIETDAGTQTRLFHFGGAPPPKAEPGWQGYSAARWDPGVPPGPAGLGFVGGGARVGTKSRSLEVVTTNLRPGYLRKNGVPYSASTTVTEYYDRFSEPNGDEWFTITTIVTDPQYLAVPFVTTTDFKKEPDGTRFAPAPCSAR
ncbi:MAG: hypothetical protein C5B51_18445 [Terriglobia bacterium]|nr:MAG: hypothetical protein C5B51_18445 [Terriglobia bacterium]